MRERLVQIGMSLQVMPVASIETGSYETGANSRTLVKDRLTRYDLSQSGMIFYTSQSGYSYKLFVAGTLASSFEFPNLLDYIVLPSS